MYILKLNTRRLEIMGILSKIKDALFSKEEPIAQSEPEKIPEDP